MTVYYRTESDKRIRKGELMEEHDGYIIVRACRTASKFGMQNITLLPHQVIHDHVPAKQKIRTLERGHGAGLCILPAESIRRKNVMESLGLSEACILTHKVMLELRRRTLRGLAATNGIAPVASDFDYEELSFEHLVATLCALRSVASKAPAAEISEFQEHLAGKIDRSRIMTTIYRTGKTAAIRYLKKRQAYHFRHVTIDDRRLAA